MSGYLAPIMFLISCVSEYRDSDGDGFVAGTGEGFDCDDSNPNINPNQSEICDSLDNNCNGEIDEGLREDLYFDADADGAGDAERLVSVCLGDSRYVDNGDDCDDSDAAIHPGAEEVCDGADNDCDGTVDGEDAVDAEAWYYDGDGDGYGEPEIEEIACEPSTSFVDDASDCDDTDASTYPAADEVCDGFDNDCDESIDEDAVDATPWYADADGDGFGNAAVYEIACTPSDSSYVSDSSDCNDESTRFYPGAPENDCTDPNDYNCDGSTGYSDIDGDGFAACEECDDTDPSVNPDALEYCDGIDNDCDSTVDEDDAVDALTWYYDGDGDGHGDPAVTDISCTANPSYVSNSSDCDDADATSFPGGTEVCDGADNDCDSTVDEEATDATTWYADADSDGYGDSTVYEVACSASDPSYVSDSSDCDDSNPSTYPGANETCDGADNDCDSTVDEEATDAPTWYADADSDGYGDSAVYEVACSASDSSYVSDSSDCDDADATSFPGGTEVCDGTDNDCDSSIDESATDAPTWYEDADGDGFGNATEFETACTSSYTSYVSDPSDATDCDDTDADTFPGAPDLINIDGIHNDCGIDHEGSYLADEVSRSFIEGDETDQRLGLGVHPFSSPGDLDGDGFAELLLGAPYTDATNTDSGAVYLYSGGSDYSGSVASNAFAAYLGEDSGDLAGTVTAELGDIDSDGTGDFGASSYAQTSSTGKVYVVSGASITSGDSSLADAATLITGTSTSAYFGYSLAGNGDFDGDGINDVAIGAPFANSYLGTASVFLGPLPSGSLSATDADYIFSGTDAFDETGVALALDGDIDADGYDDLAVSSDGVDSATGQVSVVSHSGTLAAGSYDLSSTVFVTISGNSAGDYLANEVAWLPDTDSDALPELVLGNSSYSSDNQGAVFLFQSGTISAGGTLNVTDANESFFGSTADDYMGTGIVTGNLDDDAFGDLFFGITNMDNGSASNAGLLVMLYGSQIPSLSDNTFSTDQTGAIRVFGINAEDGLGNSTTLFDSDGDGLDEVVVGAPYYDTNDEGSVSILENNH